RHPQNAQRTSRTCLRRCRLQMRFSSLAVPIRSASIQRRRRTPQMCGADEVGDQSFRILSVMMDEAHVVFSEAGQDRQSAKIDIVLAAVTRRKSANYKRENGNSSDQRRAA